MKRNTNSEVKSFIENNGCELLEEYINNRQKLLIKCKCGNLFRTSFKEFKGMNKRQCNECGKKIALEKLSLSYEEVKEISDSVGAIMTWNKQEFNEKYKNYLTLIEYKCRCGDYFYCRIGDIKKLKKNTCNKCSVKDSNKLRKYTEQYVKEYLAKYDCKLIGNYKNSYSEIIIRCKCGNEFNTKFNSYIKSKHKCCKKCSALEGSKKKRLNIEEIKEKLEEENYKLISTEYINNRKKIKIKHCKCGHEFEMAFDMFQRGNRCPYCYNSKGENKIKKWLELNNIEYKEQYIFKDLRGHGGGLLRFDFAIFKDNNLSMLIEYDGELHYNPFRKDEKAQTKLKKVQEHDQIKDNYCKNNNIKLLRIKYTEFNNIENILQASI